MQGIILSAGKGERLRAANPSSIKPLYTFFGIPLLERNIRLLLSLNFEEIVVVLGETGAIIEKFLQKKFKKEKRLKVFYASNYLKGNAFTLLDIKPIARDRFVLLMGDHVHLKDNLLKLLKSNEENVLAVSKRTDLSSVEEATLIEVRDGQVHNIGKNIKEWNYIDTGLFKFSPAVFNQLEDKVEETGGELNLSLRGWKELKAVDIGNGFWYDVDTVEDKIRGEKLFQEALRKKSDGLISRFINRKISLKLSRLLALLPFNAHFYSVLSFLLLLLSSIFFYWRWLPLGGILVQISSIIDGVDGEIARVRGEESKWGAYFDSILDRIGDSILIFSVSIPSFLIDYNSWYLILGFTALLFSHLSMLEKDKIKSLTGREFYEIDPVYLLPSSRDSRLFLIFIFSLFGKTLEPLFLISLFGFMHTFLRLFFLKNIFEKEAT
ncbi:MAG: Bifunctional IPC transferase and DIPP synthase [candidate division WS2 bacterium]|uniref:Bifunctional IPC transferase and DIPP synthase n=1 Tax=Psychracetigena formicireducens TaxID=2986056 RepID=A0A9E2BHZ3_PSYF1|nr:Bifunctional IPC transferase and DIPP synthase [Candidatus Psychracetigena formicireducens]MBT9145222.1 Bifunctional IPC transferase and DIPP synthase [Candidatus Psychracetigena formicireducens]MBT9150265.1 Bifunctional IPC transferase and DIPP synthase [Candidatus Psychracetigena formicireducens]